MEVSHFLPPSFTLEFWVRITDNSAIYSINRVENVYESGDEDLMMFGEDGQKLWVKFSDNGELLTNYTTPEDVFEFYRWHHIALSVEWQPDVKTSDVAIYSNNILSGSTQFAIPFLDSSSYRHLLGAEIDLNSDTGAQEYAHFYHGMIYQVVVWGTVLSDFDASITFNSHENECEGEIYCDTCPHTEEDGTGRTHCVLECGFDEYADPLGLTCEKCLPECTDGCLRGTDCGLCEDQLCQTCSDPAVCDVCKYGQPLTDPCECPERTYQNLLDCLPCNDACLVCSAGDQYHCTECASGFYLQVDANVCINRCPTGA